MYKNTRTDKRPYWNYQCVYLCPNAFLFTQVIHYLQVWNYSSSWTLVLVQLYSLISNVQRCFYYKCCFDWQVNSSYLYRLQMFPHVSFQNCFVFLQRKSCVLRERALLWIRTLCSCSCTYCPHAVLFSHQTSHHVKLLTCEISFSASPPV